MSRLKEIEQQLAHTERQLRLLQKIARLIVRGDLTMRDALQRVVSLVVEFMGSDSCLIYLLEDNELVLLASNTPHPETIRKVRLKLSEGLTGWVARERRVLAISREASHDPRFKFFRDLPEDTFEAFLSTPIIVRNRVAGVINVQHRDPHPHTGDEIELLTTVGELAGCLVTVARIDATSLSGPSLVSPAAQN